ncbi:MAG: transporter substrate-binding protein [Bacilli bacterium]|nr:transporter substrate-binding protein [Bacilli bacterium]
MTKKLLSFALLTPTILALTACGSQPASSGQQSAPTEISIMTEFSTPDAPGPDNPVLKEFEKRTNTILNINWISPNNFQDKLNAILASGQLPDLTKSNKLNNPQFQKMIQQGAFWDLTPFIKDYPNLAAYPQSVWDNTKINGKNYVIPSVRPLDGASYFAIRKDWLDALHLPIPQTMDDLYNDLFAFTHNPDGSLKPDVIGYNMRDMTSANAVPTVQDIYNASNGKWKLQNGKLIDTDLQPATRDALLWLNKAYNNGLIPKDFAVFKPTQAEDLAKSNKVGMSQDTVEGIWRSTDGASKIDPKADFLPLVSLTGPNGVFAPRTPGYNAVYAIPKTVPLDKLKKILSLMDYGASDEGFTLACFGLQGPDYTVGSDGFKIVTDQAVKDNISQSSFGKIFERYDKYLWAYHTGMPKTVFDRNKTIVDAREKVSIPDPTDGLYSDTYTKQGSEYDKQISDMKIQVIMGKATMNDWDNLVKKLQADPQYMKIADELNQAYQQRAGK